jgi:hypothetical protein
MIKPADKFSILKLRYKHGMSILESSELMVINLPLKKAKELINTLQIWPSRNHRNNDSLLSLYC